jgi:flagellar hook-associated protein 2
VDENGNKLKDADGNDLVTDGTDAKLTVTINGQQKELVRSSNTVNLDGLSVTLKDTTTEDEGPITFTVKADTDTIVNAIKSMVEDYNAMVTEIKEAYSTLPLEQSDGSSYEPLSDDDMADMSDTAIERYEEKAKTGLLFGDSNLSSFYSSLTSVISTLTASSKELSEIGISTGYSDGLTTLSLNETTLRSVLDSDPDKVKEVFTSSIENGDSYDGLMQSLKNKLDVYVGTTGASKGILIQTSGSTLAPTSIYSNTWQTAIDDLESQIEKWQDKMSDQVDYYTTKFTNLETLVSEMNAQSSYLSSLYS